MIKLRSLIVLPIIGLMCTSCSNKQIPVPKGYELIWNDEFDGESLDSSKWSYMIGNGAEYGNPGWGNGELQYYTDENTYIKDNQLHIVVKAESKNGFDYTSARIRTEGKFSFLYGKIEAKIALPSGKGLWPAFWMLPEEWKYDPNYVIKYTDYFNTFNYVFIFIFRNSNNSIVDAF